MFNFLKKKTIKKEEILQGIKTILLLDSIRLLEENKTNVSFSKVEQLTKREQELEIELTRLEGAGLVNSQNYSVVQENLKSIIREKDVELNRAKFLGFVKELGKVFPSSFLVEWETFYTLLKKYGLMIGEVKDYTGVVPERNITEITKVKESLRVGNHESVSYSKKRNFYDCFGLGKNRKCMKLVGDIYIDRDNYKWAKDKVLLVIQEEWRNLIPSIHLDTSYDRGTIKRNTLMRYLDDHKTRGVFSELISDSIEKEAWRIEIGGKILSGETLLIAAPEKYLKNKVEVKNIPVDPIVFQPTPFGVVVHSVWGEEAEDKVLQEYLEMNKIIQAI